MSDLIESPPVDGRIVADHVRRLSLALDSADADGIILFNSTNLLGFLGTPLGPSDRLVFGMVNRAGQTALVVPAFEATLARNALPGTRVWTWDEHEDALATAGAAAAELGLGEGRILLDRQLWIEVQPGLKRRLPKARFDLDPGTVDAVRLVKSPGEIDAIRRACEHCSRTYAFLAKRLVAGVREVDASREAGVHLSQAGASPRLILVQSGENAAVPHRATSRRPLAQGDGVVVDCVCVRDGYFGDMTRTFAIGEPSRELRRAYDAVRKAQRTAMEAIRPGATCESIDAAARAVIARAGLSQFFVHRLGHGIGLDGHEPPYLVGGNSMCLEAGMCVTVEPGVYVPGEFGVRIEDVVVVTPTGCEVLSSLTPTDVSPQFDPRVAVA